MPPEEFDRLLHQGLGRAVLYLQQHDATPYREVIVHACTHNIVFDRQSEGSRAEYLFEIIQLTGEAQFYRDAIFQTVNTLLENYGPQDDTDYRLLQLFALVRLFAQQGDMQAREFIHEAFRKYTWRDTPHGLVFATPGWEEFVELDGLDGYLFVLGYLESQALPAEEWIDEYKVWTIVDRFGAEAVSQTLEQASEQNRLSKEYFTQIQEYIARLESNESEEGGARFTIDESYIGFQRVLESGNVPFRSFFMRWGRAASDEACLRVAQESLVEEDPQRLFFYLSVFRRQRFPLAPDRLLALVEHADPKIADAALQTLQHIEHPAVRALALRLLNPEEALWWLPAGQRAYELFECQYDSRASYALDLLKTNYQPGDHVLVEKALEQVSEDARTGQYNPEEWHSLGSGLLDICKKHRSSDLIGALLIMYHWGPCSFCREYVITELLNLAALPAELAAECRHDSNPDIRELV